jgi:sugar phosphate permease
MANVDDLLDPVPSATTLSGAAAARPSGVRYLVLVAACSVALIAYFHRVGFAAGAPRIKDQLHLSADQMGDLLTVFFIGYAAFQIPGGWLVDRFGARHLLTLLVAGWSLSTGLIALIVYLPGFEMQLAALLLLRFLFGVFQAGAFPVLARVNADWMPISLRAVSQGAVWMSSRFGGAVAPLVLVPLIDRVFGNWQVPFIILAVIGFAWCVVFWVWFRNRPEEMPGVNAAELAEITRGRAASTMVRRHVPWSLFFRSRSAWFLCLSYGLGGVGANFYVGWLPTYVEKERHFSHDVAMWMTTLPMACGVMSCLIGGIISDAIVRKTGSRRWGRKLNGMFGLALAGAAIGSTIWVQDVLWLGFLFCLAFFSNDLVMAPTWAACADIGEQAAGTLGGCMNMLANFGGALGAFVAGKFFEAHHPNWLFPFYACCFILAALCWLGVNADQPLLARSDD